MMVSYRGRVEVTVLSSSQAVCVTLYIEEHIFYTFYLKYVSFFYLLING